MNLREGLQPRGSGGRPTWAAQDNDEDSQDSQDSDGDEGGWDGWESCQLCLRSVCAVPGGGQGAPLLLPTPCESAACRAKRVCAECFAGGLLMYTGKGWSGPRSPITTRTRVIRAESTPHFEAQTVGGFKAHTLCVCLPQQVLRGARAADSRAYPGPALTRAGGEGRACFPHSLQFIVGAR